MKVTRVDLRLREDSSRRLKAVASVTFDDEFVVHGIRVVEGEKGMFVAMPSKKTPDGKHKDIAHPIKSEIRQMIQEAVLSEYEKKKNG